MNVVELALLVVALGAPGDSPRGACPVELFRIARSKNANVVVYEANFVAGNELDDDEPVRAVWVMDAEDGRREGLTLVEKALAYGFDIRRASRGDGLQLTLKAQPARPIGIRLLDGCPRAFAVISGRLAVLRRIYVEASESGLLPTVRSVSLAGDDARTGETVQETIGVAEKHLATGAARAER